MPQLPIGFKEHFERKRQPLTLTDPSKPDNPIVLANAAFLELAGYRESDVIGRNCRFMQGPQTDPSVVARISAAIADHQPITTVLMNYRADGTAFWNLISIDCARNRAGAVMFFVGLQYNIDPKHVLGFEDLSSDVPVVLERDGLMVKSRTAIFNSLETLRRGIVTRLMIALDRQDGISPGNVVSDQNTDAR